MPSFQSLTRRLFRRAVCAPRTSPLRRQLDCLEERVVPDATPMAVAPNLQATTVLSAANGLAPR